MHAASEAGAVAMARYGDVFLGAKWLWSLIFSLRMCDALRVDYRCRLERLIHSIVVQYGASMRRG